jgi:hypothetical protein
MKLPKTWLFIGIFAVAVAFILGPLKRFSVDSPRRTPDFIEFYTAGTIVKRGQGSSLCNLDIQREVEREILPLGRFLPVDHPPFEAWFCVPFSLFSYRRAFVVWSLVNLIVLTLTLFLLRYTGYRMDPTNRVAWVVVWLLPVVQAFAVGQDSIFLALIFLAGFFALKKRRDFLAGLVFGAGLYRFEIILPFVFIFVLRFRRKVLAGFFSMAAACFLASFALVGRVGLRDYMYILLEVGRMGGSRANGVFLSSMLSLRAAIAAFLGAKLPGLDVFFIVLAATVLILGYAARKFSSISQPESRDFDLQFCLAVVAALLASYHLYVHELTPLILVAFLALAYESDAQRRGSIAMWKSASLLCLSLAMIFSPGVSIHRVNLTFFMVLGMAAWFSLEISALRRTALAETSPHPSTLAN